MELIKFNNTTFIMFGTIEEPYFIGSEIGKILGYARSNDAILNNVWKINKLTYLDYSSTVAHTVGNYNIENIKPTSMLLRKAGLYQLIFTSKLESAKTFEKFITEKLTIQSKPIIEEVINEKPFGNQKCIMTEFDLQVHVVSYLRKYHPNVLFTSTHGELQDTSHKRIISKMKGYCRGIPDLNIMEITDQYKGFFLELKSPTLKGVISPDQHNVIDQLKNRGYKCLVIDDYDEAIREINDYISKRVVICPTCGHVYKSEKRLQKHINLKHLDLNLI